MCGFDLRGLERSVCPECGSELELADHCYLVRPVWRRGVRVGLMAGTGVGGLTLVREAAMSSAAQGPGARPMKMNEVIPASLLLVVSVAGWAVFARYSRSFSGRSDGAQMAIAVVVWVVVVGASAWIFSRP